MQNIISRFKHLWQQTRLKQFRPLLDHYGQRQVRYKIHAFQSYIEGQVEPISAV